MEEKQTLFMGSDDYDIKKELVANAVLISTKESTQYAEN